MMVPLYYFEVTYLSTCPSSSRHALTSLTDWSMKADVDISLSTGHPT